MALRRFLTVGHTVAAVGDGHMGTLVVDTGVHGTDVIWRFMAFGDYKHRVHIDVLCAGSA